VTGAAGGAGRRVVAGPLHDRTTGTLRDAAPLFARATWAPGAGGAASAISAHTPSGARHTPHSTITARPDVSSVKRQ